MENWDSKVDGSAEYRSRIVKALFTGIMIGAVCVAICFSLVGLTGCGGNSEPARSATPSNENIDTGSTIDKNDEDADSKAESEQVARKAYATAGELVASGQLSNEDLAGIDADDFARHYSLTPAMLDSIDLKAILSEYRELPRQKLRYGYLSEKAQLEPFDINGIGNVKTIMYYIGTFENGTSYILDFANNIVVVGHHDYSADTLDYDEYFFADEDQTNIRTAAVSCGLGTWTTSSDIKNYGNRAAGGSSIYIEDADGNVYLYTNYSGSNYIDKLGERIIAIAQ